MRINSRTVIILALSVTLIYPGIAFAKGLNLRSLVTQVDLQTLSKSKDKTSRSSLVKVLSDHPGAATALTARQKSEIREILNKGKTNRNFICTGASLSGQRESMYRVVLLRARLVCDYAKTLEPSIQTIVQEKRTTAARFNGRVVVVSR